MNREDLENKAAIQAAVRQVADQYLPDANITSVGIGYKTTGGERTETLALQFTVGKKITLEAIDVADTSPIPETITANGITFDTDVIERDFKPHPVPVEADTKAERKQRLDPIMPGISIGHIRSTAGTLGCVVKDRASGELRLLSNWHVFQGETGQLGDAIVQPGPYDDNRVGQNQAGLLERSFLGLAGDCALARPSGRTVTDTVLDLGVAVREIADPELDDPVVKSGRTTAITYGRVSRVHTISKINYGSLGEKQIGGFEISADPAHPPANGEISMGGDSGSAWLDVGGDGSATDVMLGLHFAGETVEPAKVALACYASSVFSKLEIDPLGPAAGAPAVAATPDGGDAAVATPLAAGFDPGFLAGYTIDLPKPVTNDVKNDLAATTAGAFVRHYTHFSLAMSTARRFAHWVAWNIDGNSMKMLPRTGLNFVIDPEYANAEQTGDELYAKNRLDRGHIARRADLTWGNDAEANQGNVDSFFFTNITPQLDDFNQSGKSGLWGELENAIYAGVKLDNLRASLIGGPIFKATDYSYKGSLVPRSFYKIVAYTEAGVLKAKAFVLTQDDLEAKLESLGLEEFKVYQVHIADVTAATGLGFGNLAGADIMPATPEAIGGASVRRITSLEDFA